MNDLASAVPGKFSLCLRVVRCFNAAAFVALAFFYCGAFYLDAPRSGQLELIALTPDGHHHE